VLGILNNYKFNKKLYNTIKLLIDYMKRGQVTVFIILFIIILVGIGLILLFKESTKEIDDTELEAIGVEHKTSSVEMAILNCINTVSKESLEVIGVQGGYYSEPTEAYNLDWTFVPYYYKHGKNLIPEIKLIEKELENYVNDNIFFCLQNLSFDDVYLTIDVPSSKVKISSTEILFEIFMESTIEIGEHTIKLDFEGLPVTHKNSIYEILNIARSIVSEFEKDPDMICIDCMTDLALKNNLYIDMINFNEDETLVIVSEKKEAGPYVFEFLIKA